MVAAHVPECWKRWVNTSATATAITLDDLMEFGLVAVPGES